MNVLMKTGFTILGLLAVLTGLAMLFAADSVKLSCRVSCELEHLLMMLVGQRTAVSLLGLSIIVMGVLMMWRTWRDDK